MTGGCSWSGLFGFEVSHVSKSRHGAPGAHRYQVDAFVFDAKSGKYVKAVSYATSGKYPGEDREGPMRVLEVERPRILAKLDSGPEGRR